MTTRGPFSIDYIRCSQDNYVFNNHSYHFQLLLETFSIQYFRFSDGNGDGRGGAGTMRPQTELRGGGQAKLARVSPSNKYCL